MDLSPPKRAVAFIDGSNTRLAARKAFGESYANFNPLALAQTVCERHGYELVAVRFFVGVPDIRVTEDGHYAWMKRCARWERQGVTVFTRALRQDESGIAREKGIDIRLALDAVDQFRRAPFDVALLYTQDQDFAELAEELKTIAQDAGQEIEIVSVFPASERVIAGGVRGTTPVPLTKSDFSLVLDDVTNRKRRLEPSAVEAAATEPPKPDTTMETPDLTPPSLEPVRAVPDQPAGTVQILPPVSRRRQGWVPRPLRRLVGFVLILYFLGATATSGVLVWQSRAALFAPLQSMSDTRARAKDLMGLSLRALLWPKTWHDGLEIPEISDAVHHIDLEPIETYAHKMIGTLNP